MSDLTIDGIKRMYSKGDDIFIPKDAKYSVKVYAGYADISFFNEKRKLKVSGTLLGLLRHIVPL